MCKPAPHVNTPGFAYGNRQFVAGRYLRLSPGLSPRHGQTIPLYG